MSDTARPGVVTPGKLLRDARAKSGLDSEDVASSLNWLPEYVVLVEQDRYSELRRPTFARGYVKAYARLVGVTDARIQRALDEWDEERGAITSGAAAARPGLQPSRSAAGMVTGVVMLAVVVAALWWWQGRGSAAMAAEFAPATPDEMHVIPSDSSRGAP